jgi:predicted regulator of Ras-like GTPase activity (Roadblock/LC7/MglB family)
LIAADVEQYSVTAETAAQVASGLSTLVRATGVSSVLVVDRGGRIIVDAGGTQRVDAESLASLAAADFNANEQLARLVGERGFRALLHRGDGSSVHVQDVGGKAVIVTVYAAGTAPGLVSELARAAAPRVAAALEHMAEMSREQSSHGDPPLRGAEDEIDRLFDS